MPSERPVNAPISPAQAAHVVRTSRRSIMRAIESHDLKAIRDNRNRWKIDPEDLEKWAERQSLPSEHAQHDVLSSPNEIAVLLARAETERDALRDQLAQVSGDRDAWRKLAERQQVLIERQSSGWRWPWSK